MSAPLAARQGGYERAQEPVSVGGRDTRGARAVPPRRLARREAGRRRQRHRAHQGVAPPRSVASLKCELN